MNFREFVSMIGAEHCAIMIRTSWRNMLLTLSGQIVFY